MEPPATRELCEPQSEADARQIAKVLERAGVRTLLMPHRPPPGAPAPGTWGTLRVSAEDLPRARAVLDGLAGGTAPSRRPPPGASRAPAAPPTQADQTGQFAVEAVVRMRGHRPRTGDERPPDVVRSTGARPVASIPPPNRRSLAAPAREPAVRSQLPPPGGTPSHAPAGRPVRRRHSGRAARPMVTAPPPPAAEAETETQVDERTGSSGRLWPILFAVSLLLNVALAGLLVLFAGPPGSLLLDEEVDADGQVVYRFSFRDGAQRPYEVRRYDTRGSVVHTAYDGDTDGRSERQAEFQGDRRIREMFDEDQDGRVERVHLTAGTDRLIVFTDENGDQVADRIETQVQGEVTARAIDEDHDGVYERLASPRHEDQELLDIDRDGFYDGMACGEEYVRFTCP